MSKKVSLAEMWSAIEKSGIDRKLLEKTEPGEELIRKLYTAITTIHEKELELKQ